MNPSLCDMRRRQILMQKKIRILHVIDSLDLGGAQEALEHLIKYRNRELFEMRVVSMHRAGVYSPRMAQHGVHAGGLSFSKHAPLYIPNLIRLVRDFKPDIAHFHLTWANILGKPLCRIAGVRILINHDQTNERFRHRKGLRFQLDKLTNKLSDHVFAVSKSIQSFLVEEEKIPRQRVSLLYNGVDLQRFSWRGGRDEHQRQEWGIRGEEFLIAGIGRLHPQKNFSLFLKVAQALVRDKTAVRFVIVGDGPLRKKLEFEAKEAGLGRHVLFLGYVPDTRVVFNASDMLMMTSDYEGLPLTLLEAMATGVPALCSEVDGIQEILTEGRSGLLAKPGAADSFISQALRLMASASLRESLAVTARKIVESQFDAEHMAQAVEQVYLRLLSSKTQRR